MKYIIDVPDDIQKIIGFRQDYSLIYVDMTPYTEPDRKAIEDEVWEFYKTISNMKIHEQESAFGTSSWWSVINKYSYQEVKSKYEAWLKQKDEIHVGDEVENASYKKGIVLNHHISPSNGLEYVRVLYMDDGGNSFVSAWEKNNVGKTGRHFPEVAELLEKMRGEEE